MNEAPIDSENLYSEINARYLIDGSIRQSGSNVRISISLTDTKNQVKIWSEKFDKEFNAENFFNLQDEIVENVFDALYWEWSCTCSIQLLFLFFQNWN